MYYSILLLVFMNVIILTLSYRINNIGKNGGLMINSKLMASSAPPNTDKARIRLVIEGDSVNNPVFRAELKKELTFFRGCKGKHSVQKGNTKQAEIIGEGKTSALLKFLDWMNEFREDAKRKPNFQGPLIKINIKRIEWDNFVGDLDGFTTNEFVSLDNNVNIEGTVEAKNMAGTDESV